jgi:excisionase family DNA binding protein
MLGQRVENTREIPLSNPIEDFIDSKEAARWFRIHPKTLQRMARRGDVPAHRIGTLWRYRLSELDARFRIPISSECHSCRN